MAETDDAADAVEPADPADAAARRRRREAVFGDVLPDTTSDEREPDPDRGQRGDASEEWLKQQVPPHHTDTGG